MKLIKYIALSSICLLFIALACKESFLEVPPTGSISEKKIPTKAGIEGFLIATYAVLTGRGYGNAFYSGSTNWFWGSVLGGDSNKASDAGGEGLMNEVQRYATPKTNTSVTSKYRTSYEGVV
ncbi:MAG: RagB/SusD family nutrient uptake outer membrane protein, partial [Candidatus Nephrothrix sp. EaCA]